VVCGIAAESGPFDLLGSYDIIGWQAYTRWINARGGVLGRPLKLVIENDASSPSQAASVVRKCVTEDHASFIVGPEATGTGAPAIPIANGLHTVLIFSGAGWHNMRLSAADLHSYSFPGFYNAFLLDDLDAVTKLIVPRHYTRVAVIQDGDPGALLNGGYLRAYARHYHFHVVGVQTTQPGETDDTPQVLNLLAAKPQIIVLGMSPGPDTITVLKAIRAQNPTVPVAECSGCFLPSFYKAAGGYAIMRNVYVLGPATLLLHSLPNTAAYRSVASQLRSYVAGMEAAGDGSLDDLDSGAVAWGVMQELTAAIRAAKSTNEDAVRRALEHQRIEILGTAWDRSTSNYTKMSSVVDVMATWTPSGQLQPFGSATKISIDPITNAES
jgi:branched-chain amino acid transport system substrate-binding protein